jgi:hypothetical protein
LLPDQGDYLTGGELFMFYIEQKKLILRVLSKEKKKLFSRNKGQLLDKTISDISQMIRNEEKNEINDKKHRL